MRKQPKVEARPAEIVLQMKPVLQESGDCSTPLRDLPLLGMASESTNLGACDTNRAEVSEVFLHRFLGGERLAIARLLDVSPGFISEPWVRWAIERDPTLIPAMQSGGGRPVGRSQGAIAMGLAIAARADELHARTGLSYERIFQELANGANGLGAERIKHIYYETKSDRRLRPFLFVRDLVNRS